MARRLTVTDGYAVINAMANEMLGKNATITATDISSFVSVGETLLATGVENVINTLSLVASRSLIAIRPYQARTRSFTARTFSRALTMVCTSILLRLPYR